MKKKPHIDSKKNDIVRAAMRLFAEKGVDGITVKEIGAEAGVTDAAIYQHFTNKHALVIEVFSHYCNSSTKLIDYYAQQPGSFQQRFHQLIDDVLSEHDMDSCGLLILSQHHELYTSARAESERSPLDALTEFIEEGIKQGAIPQQDARLSAVIIIGAFTRMALSSFQGELPALLSPLASEVKTRLSHLLGQY